MAVACASGKLWASTVGDAHRSPVKGQWGRKKNKTRKANQLTLCPNPSSSLHQGVHGGGALVTDSCLFGLDFSASPPGTGCPWCGRKKSLKMWEKSLENTDWSLGSLPWDKKEKVLWLIKYILIQLISEEEKVCSATSWNPQESRLRQNGKFRKGFPHSPQKLVFMFSRSASL